MSYSQFILGKTNHINGQKFHTRLRAFVSPLPSRDLQDYVLEVSPKREGYAREQKRQKLENFKMVDLLQRFNDSFYHDAKISSTIHPFLNGPRS